MLTMYHSYVMFGSVDVSRYVEDILWFMLVVYKKKKILAYILMPWEAGCYRWYGWCPILELEVPTL